MDVRHFLFRYRGFTSLPLAGGVLYFAGREGQLIIPGVVLILVGELIRISGVRYAGGATRSSQVGANALCMDGPFAYVRNPLYLGNLLIYTGFVFLAGGKYLRAMMGITLSFFLVQYGLIISLEEETLSRLFGDEYSSYKKSVPRFIPRLTPWKHRTLREPASLLSTLKMEQRTLQSFIVFLCLIFFRVNFLP